MPKVVVDSDDEDIALAAAPAKDDDHVTDDASKNSPPAASLDGADGQQIEQPHDARHRTTNTPKQSDTDTKSQSTGHSSTGTYCILIQLAVSVNGLNSC